MDRVCRTHRLLSRTAPRRERSVRAPASSRAPLGARGGGDSAFGRTHASNFGTRAVHGARNRRVGARGAARPLTHIHSFWATRSAVLYSQNLFISFCFESIDDGP